MQRNFYHPWHEPRGTTFNIKSAKPDTSSTKFNFKRWTWNGPVQLILLFSVLDIMYHS